MSSTSRLVAGLLALALCGAPEAAAQGAGTGGTAFAPPSPPPAAGATAVISNGKATAPAGAPVAVRHVIVAANRLVRKPYRWGGGHATFSRRLDSAYDCSGAVSYALYGGRFLMAPLASGDLMDWGRRGAGAWITVYANASHAYVVVAGLRFDTSLHDPGSAGPLTGPRWSSRSRAQTGFVARHPRGY